MRRSMTMLTRQTICSFYMLLLSNVAVLTVSVPAPHEQTYFLALSELKRNIFNDGKSHEVLIVPSPADTSSSSGSVSVGSGELKDSTELPVNYFEFDEIDDSSEEDNTTVIILKNSTREKATELSQTAMDVITIIWYIATFLALAAFFLLMACSDRRCADELRNSANNNNGNDAPIPPPTPSPSYSQFAPPSYETVMMMQHALKTPSNIYVIPLTIDDNKDNNATDTVDGNMINNNNNNNNTPIVTFYTINELQKDGS